MIETQHEGEEEEIKALAYGAVDFLTKPYKPEIIKYRIAKTIMLKESCSMFRRVERDSITGLYTKEFFYNYVEKLLRDNPKQSFDLLKTDIDNFKLINELYGKEFGNRILNKLSRLLNEVVLNNGEIATRIVADDFFCVIPHREDYKDLLKELTDRAEADKDMQLIHIHYGVYNIVDRQIPVVEMCNRVSMATNIAKSQYNKEYVYYDDTMRKQMLDEQALMSEMQEALDKHQFEVYLQPKYNLLTEQPAGAEALVRWNHPQKGFLAPGLFVPLFENNGLIYKLDRYVWEETCRFIAYYKKKYGFCVPISVNISRIDVYDPNLPDILLGLIQQYKVEPQELHLEITETAYTREPEQLIEIVNKLKGYGFIIEMDDFGSGFSSLNMLSSLSVDILKLDMKFIQDGNFTKEDPGILKYIMEIAEWLKVQVVAEGAETKEQVEMLKSLNCNYAQGYYYAKPMPQAEFEKHVKQCCK